MRAHTHTQCWLLTVRLCVFRRSTVGKRSYTQHTRNTHTQLNETQTTHACNHTPHTKAQTYKRTHPHTLSNHRRRMWPVGGVCADCPRHSATAGSSHTRTRRENSNQPNTQTHCSTHIITQKYLNTHKNMHTAKERALLLLVHTRTQTHTYTPTCVHTHTLSAGC